MPKRKSEEPPDLNSIDETPKSKRVRIDKTVEEREEPVSNGAVRTAHVEEEDDDQQQADNQNGHSGHENSVTNGLHETDESEEDEQPSIAPLRQSAPLDGYGDLYLDTINRHILDFDFEKLCSVTLSNINVYACLVCGKYFQGRGPKSQAYFHALEVDHHVYINMETKKVYVLPEGYEVLSRSLDDIKYVVDPKFTEEEVKKLDRELHESIDLANKKYRPGFMGMNNIKANDYLNVVVQMLAHVPALRNFLLLHVFGQGASQLPVRFSTLVRKLWNSKAFRNHVSPHELLQEIAVRSSKKFTLTHQSDPVEFLSWFLHNLHLALGGSKTKPFSSIIQRTFQGRLSIESQAIRATAGADRLRFEDSTVTTTQNVPYQILTLDLPPTPLFRDAIESKNIIPQVPLTTLLQKYSGLTATEKSNHRVRHRLLHPLPPYLFFHIKRFSTNKFVAERNPTIVTFPSPRGLDMSPYVQPDPNYPQSAAGSELVYDLLANIVLDAADAGGRSGGGDTNAADAASGGAVGTDAKSGQQGPRVSWKVQLRDKAAGVDERAGGRVPEWVEIQDLIVRATEAETLFTKEGYLMVWERRRTPKEVGTGKSKGKSRAG